MDFLTNLFDQYGYVVLFFVLVLELFLLPTPGSTLMTYCGFLVFKGTLNYFLCIAVATSGAIIGITIAYFIGKKLGLPLVLKYGKYVRFDVEKLDAVSKLFNKYGNGFLSISYFVLGLRHVVGYFSGITQIPYKKFAINAYIGALLWATCFISLGKFLGYSWNKLDVYILKYSHLFIVLALIVIFIIFSAFILQKYKKKL